MLDTVDTTLQPPSHVGHNLTMTGGYYELRYTKKEGEAKGRSLGKWCVYWSYEGSQYKITRAQNGERLDTKERATRVMSSIRTEIDENRHDPLKWLPPDRNKYAVKQVVQRYKDKRQADVYADRLDASWHNKVSRAIDKHFLSYCQAIRKYDLRDVTGADLEKLFNSLDKSHKWQNRFATMLSGLFSWAHRYDRSLKETPMLPEPYEIPDNEIRCLSDDQQKSGFDFVPLIHRPIFMFLFMYGPRESEARGLQIEDVYPDQDLIVLRHSQVHGELKTRTKNVKKRDNPVEPFILAAMKGRISGYVFPNPNTGKPYNDYALGEIWRKCRLYAKLGDITLREASRKTAIGRMVGQGAKWRDVAEFFGNTPAVAKRHYAKGRSNRKFFSSGKLYEIKKV